MTEVALMRRFGSNLKKLLDYCNMSQKELSLDTDITESTISCYIRGERMPSLKNIINIMYAIECEFEDLIDINEPII